MAAPDLADPELARVEWNLDPLLDGAGSGAAGVDALLDEAQRRADAFADAHAGKVAALDGPGLVAAMQELATLQDLIGRAGSYAALRFSTNTADPQRGALLQKVQERGTQIETRLLFFELEWAALDDERADELLGADGGGLARHPTSTARTCSPSPRRRSSPRSR
jgi:oligoendopeptidase F